MNILTRDFTKNEKILLVILGIVILVSLYYLLIFIPVNDGIAMAKTSSSDLETQLVTLDDQVEQIKAMQQSVNDYTTNGHVISMMPSYNAGKQELDFLNTTLAESQDYYVGFTNITREGNQIRREFSMKFKVEDYAQAEEIIYTLEHSEIRCLISDFSVNSVEQGETVITGEVEVSCSATFYETMYDGIVDSELPADSKPADETAVGTYEYQEGSLAQ